MKDKAQGYAHLIAKITELERELAAAIEQRDEMKLALRDLTDAAKGLMDCKGYDLFPDGTMRPAHGLGEWVRAIDYDKLHATAEAAQSEIAMLRKDAEGAKSEYRQPEAAVVFNKTLTGCEIKLTGGGGG
jgi:hypothetical protein